jgi:Ca2+-transporting ATPase
MKINKGLSAQEVNDRLKTFGYNELPTSKPKSLWHIAFEVIKEPMFILLISCGTIYMVLGNYREGAILMSSIFIIIFITFYQYQKTEKALNALKKLSSPRALVVRDNQEMRIAGREVVPDDIVLLHEGDRIPADAKVLVSQNLTVDESMLTGESIPVVRDNDELVFSGTLVVQGKATIKITATGSKTQFGKIGTSLQSIEQDETRLQKEMKLLIRNLFIVGAIISVIVVLAFYYTRGNFIASLLNGIASAMAILPEEFPVVLTVFLALGAWRLSKNNVLTRKSSAIESLGSATVLCSDKTGTITQNKMEIAALFCNLTFIDKKDFEQNKNEIEQLLNVAKLASQIDAIDPMEKAIAITKESINPSTTNESKLIKEYPLSKELFAMTRVMENLNDHSITISTKGAPEAIFNLCKLNEADKTQHLKTVNEMAKKGYRVIAVADSIPTNNVYPETLQEFEFTFLGLIGFIDPIRAEVPNAIKECTNAGIKVIMITGDYPETAKSIGLQIGLDTSKKIVTGDELDKMDDEQLKQQIGGINIFARVIPEQKLRIVQALKSNNEIVAMTGDGVNDAPALKAANIGIAMGNKGTDVAREAASLVLLDDNFASIVSAIRSGRKIFDNLQKAMSYIIAIHIPIIGLALLPAFFTSLPLLLLPLHIVFMELIIDPVCSVAFESEAEENGIMNRLPRNPNELFFGGRKIFSSALKGALLLAMVVIIYFISVHEKHTLNEIRAITFSALIIGNIFLILTDLSKTKNFISVLKEGNKTVLFILTVALIMLLLINSVPFLQKTFSFEFPGYYHFIPSAIGSFSLLMVLELYKYFKNKNLAQ